LAPGSLPSGRPDRILVRATDRTVVLPPGTTVDPGGLGKGLAADIVVDELLASGASGALVEIGGDLRVQGRSPRGDGWEIETAGGVVALRAGGVATSTTRLRAWTLGGERRHHLVDPVTLRSTVSDVEVCTVIAGSGAWAEAFTKVAFARGADRALADYEDRRLAASVTTANGTFTTAAWEEYRR
jgi:thiamine biosynthesis lipoprotein